MMISSSLNRICLGLALLAVPAVTLLAVPAVVRADAPPPAPLSEARVQTIVGALLAREWNPAKVVAEKDAAEKAPESDVEQLRLWQGNSPRFDFGFMDVKLAFSEKIGTEFLPLELTVDMETRFLRARYSENVHPWYRGGIVFEDFYNNRIVRTLLPGKDDRSLLLFVPPMGRGDDLYMLACPRLVKARDSKTVNLQPIEWKPEAMVFHVFGQGKARLLAGTSASGGVGASIEQSSGIPAPQEPRDEARGRNPQIELTYRPADLNYPLQPFPESGAREERFVMHIDMRLPSGHTRRVTQGYNFWLRKVEIPEVEMGLPLKTLEYTSAARSLSRVVRNLHALEGVATVVHAGACLLMVGERTRPVTTLSKVEASQPGQEVE